MGQIATLFRLRWLSFKNSLLRPSRGKRFRWVFISVLAALFVAADFWFFLRIIRYFDGLPLNVGDELIVQMLNVIFLTLMVMVLFSSLIVCLSVFFLARDLPLTHSLPVPTGSVFFARFYQSVLHSSWMMLLFGLPIFVAYGHFHSVDWKYYLYLLAGIVPYVMIPCIFGCAFILLLMRYFPTKKAHQVLSFLGLVVLVGLIVYLRFLSPEKFFGREVSDAQIMVFVESLRVPDYPFLPSSWMTLGLASWVEGDTGTAGRQLLYLYGAAAGSLVVLWALARRIYFDGWCMVQEVKNAPVGGTGSKFRLSAFLEWLPVSPERRALLMKDLRVFARDPEQWSQIFILCALVFVYIFNIMNLPLHNVVLKNVVSVLNIGLVGFVLSALCARFVFTATSIEGRKIWTIYTAPVEMKKFLWSKFWMFFPPLLFVAEFLVVVSNWLLQVDAYVMNVSIVSIFLVTAGLVGLGLGLGAMYPMFEHENISEIPAGTGGILYMTSSLAYIAAVLMLVGRPMYVHFNEKFLFKSVGGLDVPICYTLIFVLTLAVTFLPLKRGIEALKKMDV